MKRADATPPPGTKLLAAALAVAFMSLLAYWYSNPVAMDNVRAQSTGYRINVNQADVDELQLLPSIGPARAERVVEFRLTHDPFVFVSDLTRVNTIGPVVAQGVEPYVRFE